MSLHFSALVHERLFLVPHTLRACAAAVSLAMLLAAGAVLF